MSDVILDGLQRYPSKNKMYILLEEGITHGVQTHLNGLNNDIQLPGVDYI